MGMYDRRSPDEVRQSLATSLANPGKAPSDHDRVERLQRAANSRHPYKRRLARQKLREFNDTMLEAVEVVLGVERKEP